MVNFGLGVSVGVGEAGLAGAGSLSWAGRAPLNAKMKRMDENFIKMGSYDWMFVFKEGNLESGHYFIEKPSFPKMLSCGEARC